MSPTEPFHLWLPRHLVNRRAPLPAVGEEEHFDGTLLRLDIPDYSARPDRLSTASAGRRRERDQAEDLADAVEAAFLPIFHAVDRHNGSVASFEGDALLALFRGRGHALRAQAALDDILAVRPTLHAAIASGAVSALHLGGGEQRHELLHGPALAALEQLESDSAAIALDYPGAAEEQGPLLPLDDAELLRFVPPPLRGRPAPPPVHRRVVSIFVAAPLAQAAPTYRALAEEAEAQHALLLKVRAEAGSFVAFALVGAPAAREDDNARALAFATRVRDRLVDAEGVRVRIAMAEGPVLALVLGDASHLAWDVLGDSVNVAYRMLGDTRAGDILATSSLVESVRDAVAAPVETLRIRGKTRPVAVRRVLSLRTSGRLAADPTYPRRRELAQLDALLDANRPVGVIAAAGMGKRYLWQEWAARNSSWRVLRATCRDHGAVRPLAPFVGAVRRLGGEAPTRNALQASLRALPGMDDRSTAVLDAFVASGTPQLAAVSSALRQCFHGLAEASPTLLVVEDVQWLDEDASALLARLIADAPRTGLRLLVTARPRTRLPSGLASVELGALPLDAARTLARERLGERGSDAALVERVVKRAAGSPRELAALADAARRGEHDIPESIESWYAARIDALDAAAREVLERAAILGRTLDQGLLRRLAADVPQAEEGLRTLYDQRLLIPDDLGARLAFDREATREIAYMRMTTPRRRQLHTRAGRVLQARAASGVPVAPEVLAWHLSRSDAPGESLRPLVEACRRALAHGRPRLALSHAETAARIARAHDPEMLPDVQRVLGDSMLALGRADLALEAFRAIQDPAVTIEVSAAMVGAGFAREALAAVEGMSGAMATAVRARALSLLGSPEAPGAHAAALESAGTAAERARALRFYGSDLLRHDRFDAAASVLNEAVRLAQIAGDPGARADALDLLGGVLTIVGELDRALSAHRAALSVREVLGRPEGVAHTLRRLGRAESRAGRSGQALGHLVAARALLRDAGAESRLGRIEVDLAEVRWRRGEVDHAVRHLDASPELSGRSRSRHAVLSALTAAPTDTEALARARAVVAADRWHSGGLLMEALGAARTGDSATLTDRARALRELRHAEFADLADRWVALGSADPP